MYPQNVDDGMEEDEGLEPPQTRIPVGFPGMQQPSFHRRIEDDGISIAQSEQLPPYSEYPEDGAPPNIVLPHVQNSTPQAPPPAHTPFASRIPQSMSDVRDQRPESALFLPDAGILTEEQIPKKWSEKSWKEKRKTKFCGILFEWWLFVAAAVLVVVVVIAASIPQAVNSPNPPPVGATNSSITASAQYVHGMATSISILTMTLGPSKQETHRPTVYMTRPRLQLRQLPLFLPGHSQCPSGTHKKPKQNVLLMLRKALPGVVRLHEKPKCSSPSDLSQEVAAHGLVLTFTLPTKMLTTSHMELKCLRRRGNRCNL